MVGMIAEFSHRLARYTDEEQTKILTAAEWSERLHGAQKRASGEPYFIHPLRVAELLVEMEMDADTITAALLHDVLEDTEITGKEIQDEFGPTVEALVDGVTKIDTINSRNKNVQQADTIRKMFFAMTKDIRVILIKLADKFHNMNTLEHQPLYKRKATAAECLDIYAPLAERLGIFWMKAELEDLSLKHLNPMAYEQIKSFLAEKRTERSSYLKRVEEAILEEADTEHLTIEVMARAKHFYSVYQKMKRRDKDLEEIYDLLGIRILCDHPNDCYTLLGLVHRLWPPIEGRFKDYIAMPKANNYQSLHTTVMCYDGKPIEIQIRTQAMHMTAEYGIAAHWAYKQGRHAGPVNTSELAIINKLNSWDDMDMGSGELLEEIKSELLKESIYVFTPEGDIVELPKGSTPIDFAYHIHTEIGNRCQGAKADGSIIALNVELKNTQMIEILTSVKAHPHVNWLRHVKTARARSKIRHWINTHEDNMILDRNIIAKQYEAPEETDDEGADDTKQVVKRFIDRSKVVFRIGGEKNMMIKIAKCCNPATGDDIIGYISRGRGIIVHKRECTNLSNINEIGSRSIEVQWEAVSPRAVERFRVKARRTSDLFSEIEGAVRKYKGHLIEGKLEEDERGNLAGAFTLELDHEEDFKRVLKSIRLIPAVMNVQTITIPREAG